ncbi:aminotransferase [Metabacillus litoralis]|uniref:Aminotransferase n=1 Tax=Metabacillus litoralis TaxID=152268 RepID=A0A5C6W5Z8_9BACI|nr:aminotransferase [Metabacillus litoralis]TXC91264.1 aminotransferase [Metabacillus litoralis]
MIEPSHYISKTVKDLKPSGIRKFFDLAASMEGVISLGVGEPDFVTPWSVREASILSLEQGFTSYTANAGLLELREEIAYYLQGKAKVSYNPKEQVLVTVGASQALDVALRAIVNPGDEVIVIEPSFVSYSSLISLAGGVPVSVQTSGEMEFKLQPAELEKAITEKTKAIILCSPSNPTGTVLEHEELVKIAEIIEKHDLLVISDEIYAELTYDHEYTSFVSIEGMAERTILVSGFSKGFAMTGWRLGYIAAHKDFLSEMLKIHQYSMMCAPTMAQYAAIEAMKNGREDVLYMKKKYKQRRNLVVSALNEMDLTCHVPGGAFYVFPSIKKTNLTSEEFAEQLLLEEKVAVVPGNVFGDSGEGYIRCSYASSLEQLQEALRRMQRFVENKI